mmetsp:Transcript_12690/g.24267  ORF Transcript_12690/g.24267 Transcript_12690/m.24267 type:complete len:258 (+) Transcript_12690:209-982(+)
MASSTAKAAQVCTISSAPGGSEHRVSKKRRQTWAPVWWTTTRPWSTKRRMAQASMRPLSHLLPPNRRPTAHMASPHRAPMLHTILMPPSRVHMPTSRAHMATNSPHMPTNRPHTAPSSPRIMRNKPHMVPNRLHTAPNRALTVTAKAVKVTSTPTIRALDIPRAMDTMATGMHKEGIMVRTTVKPPLPPPSTLLPTTPPRRTPRVHRTRKPRKSAKKESPCQTRPFKKGLVAAARGATVMIQAAVMRVIREDGRACY